MTSNEYLQLKAFARQDGALLALLWVFTSSLYIIGLTNPLIGMAATFLILYTPFFVGTRLRKFRDYGREGLISFGRGYAYTVLVFFCRCAVCHRHLSLPGVYGSGFPAESDVEGDVLR